LLILLGILLFSPFTLGESPRHSNMNYV
jgi:hypothetical protein